MFRSISINKHMILDFILIFMGCIIASLGVNLFLVNAQLLSGGATGVALILEYLYNIPSGITVFFINIPLFFLSYKTLNKKFTLYSAVGMVSLSISLMITKPLSHLVKVDDLLLYCIYGGVLCGLGYGLVFSRNGSTGGTDFIALYVSNKINKAIWEYIFVFNALLLIILGFLFGWDRAGYSLIFQFVTTYTISKFYTRYARVTIQVITAYPDEIISDYMKIIHHGTTKAKGIGGYSNKEYGILYAVVSSYEVAEVVNVIKNIDSNAIINIYKTEDFYGKFHLDPI